jgi:cation diffusion facilitator CzcD-associated flavoprotein CzcO
MEKHLDVIVIGGGYAGVMTATASPNAPTWP